MHALMADLKTRGQHVAYKATRCRCLTRRPCPSICVRVHGHMSMQAAPPACGLVAAPPCTLQGNQQEKYVLHGPPHAWMGGCTASSPIWELYRTQMGGIDVSEQPAVAGLGHRGMAMSGILWHTKNYKTREISESMSTMLTPTASSPCAWWSPASTRHTATTSRWQGAPPRPVRGGGRRQRPTRTSVTPLLLGGSGHTLERVKKQKRCYLAVPHEVRAAWFSCKECVLDAEQECLLRVCALWRAIKHRCACYKAHITGTSSDV
eukprot:jgi/Mesvir1/20930/Mv08001-RA.1